MVTEFVTLHDDDPAPVFEQVRRQIAEAIGDGRLVPGQRLPTVRALAGGLHLAVNTVARAYRELETAGLVETRGRSGTVVSARAEPAEVAAVRAAQEYARRAHGLGLGAERALAYVRAALAEVDQH